MLVKLSFFVLLVSIIQCGTRNAVKEEREQFKQIYLNQFKLTYFRKLLLKGFNNSEGVRSLVSSDFSGFTEPVMDLDDYRFIDSMVHQDNQYLIQDSIDGKHRAEGAQGKRVLGFILYKMESKWLDGVANRRYKRHPYKSF